MDKKGDYKYGIILYLILGLLVLTISILFIFQEFWTGDDGDKEVCWQSVQLRALMPEYKKAGINVLSFKSDYPLKCKTSVVEISESDVRDLETAQMKIADAMVECWALFGKGDLNAFPSKVYGDKSTCVPCARIHLTDDAKKYMETEKINLSIKGALGLRMSPEFTYYSYLENSGNKFPALNPASSREFDLNGKNFSVDVKDQVPAIFLDKSTGLTISQIFFKDTLKLSTVHVNKVYLPEFFEYDKGDLLINYGVAVSSKDSDIGNYIPYLFYFQSGQAAGSPNSIRETEKTFIDGAALMNTAICEFWEGIPA